MLWQDFENRVRSIAQARWRCNAVAETIAGIKCDCVLKLDRDRWIAIEITKENDLDKVRKDILKLRTIRSFLFSEEIYCKCYFVMEKRPTDSMRESGNANKISVLSFEEFQNEYFDYSSYIHLRKRKSFGSLIDVETGRPEENTYIEVKYKNRKSGEELSVLDIAKLLKKGRRIILKGDFGLGKSRCIKQLFEVLTASPDNNPYTIAINLREHWGAKRYSEILSRHFEELGLKSDDYIKTFDLPNVIYLLDGFDEIGTQSWSSDSKKMHHIREMSVCALKDLITKAFGGILISGRDYYFNSDLEMLNCLGLNANNTMILECHQEFTEPELLSFIQNNLEHEGKLEIGELPVWLPKRPLIIQLLMKYAGDIFSMESTFENICSFWHEFFVMTCERESKIYTALNPETIQRVLLTLADKTRLFANNVGPITQLDLSEAFQEATGYMPNDESAILLQRLPSLGRISADSPDRQFLDTFILNGLRAESIIQMQKSWNQELLSIEWKNPLDEVGLSILSEYISKDKQLINSFISLSREASKGKNSILASDIIAALCLVDSFNGDFKGISVKDGHFTFLSFEGKEIKRLLIEESIIEKLDLTNSRCENDVLLQNCIISSIYGIASYNSLPDTITDCEIEHYEAFSTTSLIKKAKLSESQMLFVVMLRKLFFQPGSGRKEEALLKGMGNFANKKKAERILNILYEENITTSHKGDEGLVYKPNRKYTNRILNILNDLTLSKDPLWKIISNIS